jgi:hypothetical protein
MKKALIVLVGLMAVTAYAGDMNIFFAADSDIASAGKSAGALDLGDITGVTSQTVYLYANLNAYDYAVFNGLGISFDAVGGAVSGGALYNPNMGGDGTPKGGTKAFRFQNGSVAGSDPLANIGLDGDGDLAGAAVSSSAFALLGIGALPTNGDYAGSAGDTLAYSSFPGLDGDAWTFTYLLGEITIDFNDAPGGLDLGVANDWITLGGDEFPWATVSFGSEIGVEYDGRETGAGLNGAYNDIVWTPEPASLILLALGALVIRRR